MALIVYPVTYTSADARSYAFRSELPIRFACPTLPPGFNTNSDSLWNCNLCGSAREFYQPFERGDIIPFQMQLNDNYNNRPFAPNFGIKGLISSSDYLVKLELLDGDGNVLSDVAEDFCENYLVGWSEKVGSFQTWFVNTGLLPNNLKCFSIKITHYKRIAGVPSVEGVYYTEPFRQNDSCRNTVLLQSSYSNTDCNGNFYGFADAYLGTDTIRFYNSIRVWGSVDFVGESEERETNDRGIVLRQTIIKNYKIISGIYPPYYINKVSQTVRGNAVTVDGSEFKEFEFPDKSDENRMFELDLSFNKQCNIDNRSCNF